MRLIKKNKLLYNGNIYRNETKTYRETQIHMNRNMENIYIKRITI